MCETEGTGKNHGEGGGMCLKSMATYRYSSSTQASTAAQHRPAQHAQQPHRPAEAKLPAKNPAASAHLCVDVHLAPQVPQRAHQGEGLTMNAHPRAVHKDLGGLGVGGVGGVAHENRR